jgi:NAD(P)-dependent dehydrogenase (short-subunit alcohol dehydrogenase family)
VTASNQKGSLEGKVAIVTGANRGIGKCIARRFACEGARVVLVARAEEELIRTLGEIEEAGYKAIAVRADVSDPEQVGRVVKRTLEQFGSIDILVNNAGSAGPTLPVEEWPLDEWEGVLSSNLKSAFLCLQQVTPIMKRQGDGRIINISSITGKRPLRFRVGYATSKMGIIGLTRTMADELGPYGITVNAICPGYVRGDRISQVIQQQSRVRGESVESVEDEFVSASPLRRLVDPEHVAATALFLASDAGGSITGEDINVSAGVVMY